MKMLKRAAQVAVNLFSVPVSIAHDIVSNFETTIPSTVITVRKMEQRLDEIADELGKDD